MLLNFVAAAAAGGGGVAAAAAGKGRTHGRSTVNCLHRVLVQQLQQCQQQQHQQQRQYLLGGPLFSPPIASSFSTSSSRSASSASVSSSSSAVTTWDSSWLRLNALCDNPGATNKGGRRIGRGCGSSKGKTSGRGHKGQKSRNGRGIPITFEGGQTPLYQRIPKRGFNNDRYRSNIMIPINLGTLQDSMDMLRFYKIHPPPPSSSSSPPASSKKKYGGKKNTLSTTGSRTSSSNTNTSLSSLSDLLASNHRYEHQQHFHHIVLNLYDMQCAGMFKSNACKHGVKLLSNGYERWKGGGRGGGGGERESEPKGQEGHIDGTSSNHQRPIHLFVSRASSAAIVAVEQVGGGLVTTVHYNRLALRHLLRPEKFIIDTASTSTTTLTTTVGEQQKIQDIQYARPPSRLQPYYTNYHKRGYLNPMIQLRNWYWKHYNPNDTNNNNNNNNNQQQQNQPLLYEKVQDMLTTLCPPLSSTKDLATRNHNDDDRIDSIEDYEMMMEQQDNNNDDDHKKDNNNITVVTPTRGGTKKTIQM